MPDRIGLIAGNGRFPILLAQGARKQGLEVVAVALDGEAAPDLEEHVDVFHWSGMTKLGRVIRVFKDEGIARAYMAGGVRKAKLYERLSLKMIPDWRTATLFYKRARDNKDHTLLEAVVEEFANEGIHFHDSTEFMGEHLAKEGVMTKRRPTEREAEDIAFGWDIGKRVAAMQIGQTLIVKDKCVVAVEAVEGTDDTIQRAGALSKKGAVVIKLAKPGQDMRFDVPTIGVQTVSTLKDAGIEAVGVEAGKTLMLDKRDLLAAANAAKLTIVGR